MKKNRYRLYGIFRKLKYALKLIWKYTPTYFWMSLIDAIGQTVWTVGMSIFFVRFIFDAIESSVSSKEIFIVIALVSIYVVLWKYVSSWFSDVYYVKMSHCLYERIRKDLYAKSMILDQSCYDCPEYYNDFILSLKESEARLKNIMVSFRQTVSAGLSTVFICVYTISVNWLIAVGVICATMLGYIINNRIHKIQFDKSLEMTAINRKLSAIQRVFYLSDYAYELRQFGSAEMMQKSWQRTNVKKIECIKKYNHKLIALSALLQLLTGWFFDAIMTGYLIIQYAISQTMSLGDFSASINCIWILYRQLNGIVSNFSKIQADCEYVNKFKTFMEYEPKIQGGEKIPGSFKTLEIENVSFVYPNNPKTVTESITLKINKGEKIAFVGLNGAGKTTLVKLIMRLYDPTDGCIKYNGVDIREYDLSAYRASIGAIFQDFKLFAVSLAENVCGGSADGITEDSIKKALKKATFNIDNYTLANGVATLMTREFDPSGVIFSGGEQQKVALSRLFVRPYQILIMDEPTGALDPISEYNLNNSIMNYSEDQTIIFIAHRLSTVQMADRIYVFNDGKIIEQGTHIQLMRLQGLYSKMYNRQASKYQ